MAGFVYIMTNEAFPNLVKVGKSSKDPKSARVNELNQTGVPLPFKVEYYAFVENSDVVERLVHKSFDDVRPNKAREFFKVSVGDAILQIRDVANAHDILKYEEVFFLSAEDIAVKETKRKEEEKKLKHEALQQEKIEAEKKQKKVEYQRHLEAAQRKEKLEQKEKRKAEWSEYIKGLIIMLGAFFALGISILAPILSIPAIAAFVFLSYLKIKKDF